MRKTLSGVVFGWRRGEVRSDPTLGGSEGTSGGDKTGGPTTGMSAGNVSNRPLSEGSERTKHPIEIHVIKGKKASKPAIKKASKQAIKQPSEQAIKQATNQTTNQSSKQASEGLRTQSVYLMAKGKKAGRCWHPCWEWRRLCRFPTEDGKM